MTVSIDRGDTSARRAMIVTQLRTCGVNSPDILMAMARVPREQFVPEVMRDAAYIDRAIPLGDGAYLASPLVHARMLEEALPGESDRALLVGDSQGYMAAVLRPMVQSLDVIAPDAAGRGEITGSEYSLIIIDGAAERIPAAFNTALAKEGRLLTGIVDRGVTRLAIGSKGMESVALLALADMGIPALPEFAKPKAWSF